MQTELKKHKRLCFRKRLARLFIHLYLLTMQLLKSHIPRRTFNPGQNIWNKRKKSSKTGQDKKSLISTFACVLTAIAKIKFLEWGLGARQCLHPNLRFS